MVETPDSHKVALTARPVRSAYRNFATIRTILALILREMSTRYGRTPGGYLWTVLEPLAAVLFLSLGFSLIFASPPLGTSFFLFYATGYMPFELYITLSRACRHAIDFSRPLLRYPAVTWVDAILARFFLNGLTGAFNTVLLMTGIMLLDRTQATAYPPLIGIAILLSLLLGLGIGAINQVITAFFPIWDIIWSVINRPLFIASGTFFLYDDMPELAQDVLWYNPLIHIVGLMRKGFYPTYSADYASITYVLLVSMTLITFGFLMLNRYNREIVNR
ncbi:ABC transporter permease [Shimia sp. R9_1]|uniref:ABC transporter permease n=1 Tax=unclassified Shimia TaxID=2630038 RepID=UPI001ADD4AEF|nr:MULTISPECIES: ABC transporter permease [unclassified Shimia]MBO9395305.1 ABC transporter permease [Shimia sp. R9_2]MBO9407310.1 ABC transporter permease [Shimia sp. R9_1]